MSEKPEIKVGQRWLTQSGQVLRVLAVDGSYPEHPVVTEDRYGDLLCHTRTGLADIGGINNADRQFDLISLAPTTVKRTVALYGFERNMLALDVKDTDSDDDEWRRISEPLEIEFTLLPGESAE